MWVLNLISYLVGRCLNWRWPGGLGPLSVRIFVRFYKIDASAAAQPLDQYPSIGAFFGRDLRPQLRPLAQAALVSPVDGTLRGAGRLDQVQLEQIKGRRYELSALLGSRRQAERFAGGCYYNLYLCPRDYHHVHAPVGGEIRAWTYIPGTLWPVTDWSARLVPGLFCRNERLVLYIEGATAAWALVMVGALNVGSLSLSFTDLVTNNTLRFWSRRLQHFDCSTPIQIVPGERLGSFRMGSTVVLVGSQPGGVHQAPVGKQVLYGQDLGWQPEGG